MNRPTVPSRNDSGLRASKTFSAAVAALAAAMLALNSSDLMAASGSWQANTADQGVGITVSVSNSSWNLTDTNSSAPATFVEGDAVLLGNAVGAGLGTNFTYYYSVGVGSTPSPVVRFSSSPSGTTFAPSGVAVAVSKVPTWFTTGNWSGGIVPNGIDDAANIAPAAPIAPQTAMTTLMLDRNVTVGSLLVDTTNCGPHATESATPFAPLAGSYGLSLIAAPRNDGLLPTLTFKTSTGMPTVTVGGGNSLSFSDSKIVSTTPGNAGAKLAVAGNQGLIINNLNPVTVPVAVDARSVDTPTSAFPTYGVGPVRFGLGLDWSQFSGDLTLAQGVFQPLGGGATGNGFSSLPLNSKVILGTTGNVARLEIPSNSANNAGSTVVRGLEGTNSSIINTRQIVPTGTPLGIGSSTFEVGMYGAPTDSFTYAGNIGDSTYSASVASVSAVRFVKIGPGTQILSGVNNLNALALNTVVMGVYGGKLSLGTTGAIGTIAPDGQGAANADSSFVLKNGEFDFSGVGVGVPRSQAFGGMLIPGTVQPQTFSPDFDQSTRSTGFGTLTVTANSTPGSAQPATLTFGALRVRNNGTTFGNLNGTTMLYRGTGLGSAPGNGIATIKFTTAPGVGTGLAGGGALNSTSAPVLKGALADTSPTGTGAGFATYDSTNGVRLLNGSEQSVVNSASAYDIAPTTDNTVLNLTASASILGHQSNTLQIANSSGASLTVSNTNSNIHTNEAVASGITFNAANGLLFSGTSPIVLTGGQISGTVNTDAEDIVIHSINTSAAGVTLQTPVFNACTIPGSNVRQGWITYNGPGNLRLEGAQTVGIVGNSAVNSVGGMAFNGTGTTTIAAPIVNAATLNVNKGIVKLDTGAAWTNTPRLILAGEATFDFNGVQTSATANRFTDIFAPFTANGALALNAGGVVTNSSPTAVELRLSTNTNGAANAPFFGTITGNLSLVVDKSSFNSTTSVFTYGTQSLANVNTYTGETKILSGTLNIARGGQLPPTTVVTLGTPESAAIGTLSLGDSNNAGGVRQTIAGLKYEGTGASAVINNGSLPSQLTLNIASGPDNVYYGNLGVDPATVSNGVERGAAANSFGLRKIGPGTFEPAGALNNYTGGTIIQGGTLRVSSDAKLGQVGLLIGATSSPGAPVAPMSAFQNSIILDGGTLQTSTTFVLNANRGIGLGPISGSTGGTGTLSVDQGTMLTYDGIIASAGNTGSQTLVKNGTGLLVLGGASTFTGVTQVSAGTLGGTGSLASGVTVNSGGAIAPGVAGVGTFNVAGPLTFNAGSALSVDLGTPATPGSSDLIQLAGGAVSATGTTTVNITALSGFGVGSYTLISGGGAVSASNFVVGSIPSGYNGTFSAAGGALTLTIAEGSALTGLETWRQTNFGTTANTGTAADTFDADGDGLANLLEYATGTNPNVSNVSPVTVARDGNFLTLTYTRIADTTLTYTVEGTSDLTTSWTTVTTGNNPSTGVMNTAGPVTVTDTTAITSRRFLRLKVSY